MPKPALNNSRHKKQHERAWHEGTVVEVRSGTWRAWRARSGPDRRRVSRTFKGEGAALRAATWAKGDVEPAVLLLGHWLDRWLALRLPIVRPQTKRNYRAFVEACGPLAHLPLSTLTPEQLQAHTNALLGRWARSTVNSWRAIISSALLAAVPAHLPANPMRGVRLPKPEEKPVKAWSPDEVERLTLAAAGKAHEAWLWLSIGTGIRLGEARALLWSDVDLVARTITVSKALDHDTDRVGPTKSGKTRVVDLPDELVPILTAQRARQAPKEQRVCVSTYSRRIPDPKTLEIWIKRLCLEHGVSPLSPHATRHTYATLSLEAGVPLKEVSEQLGHADIAITGRIYSHALKVRQRRAAVAIGAILKPPKGQNGTRLARAAGADQEGR